MDGWTGCRRKVSGMAHWTTAYDDAHKVMTASRGFAGNGSQNSGSCTMCQSICFEEVSA